MEEVVKLPTKTKIAAWWAIILAIIQLPFPLAAFFSPFTGWAFVIFVPSVIFSGCLLIVTAFLILKRKKIGWWLGVSILFVILISLFYPSYSQYYTFFSLFIFPLLLLIRGGHLTSFGLILISIPLILLLFDRKNFWKIAT